MEQSHLNLAGTRTQARVCALQLLFMMDGGGGSEMDYWDNLAELHVPYASTLFQGAMGHADQIDPAIEAASLNWTLARMTRVDRNVLRLAVFEARYLRVPGEVVIAEATKLADALGTEHSASFVRGILTRLL